MTWGENRGRGRGTFLRGRGRFLIRKATGLPNIGSHKWAQHKFQVDGDKEAKKGPGQDQREGVTVGEHTWQVVWTSVSFIFLDFSVSHVDSTKEFYWTDRFNQPAGQIVLLRHFMLIQQQMLFLDELLLRKGNSHDFLWTLKSFKFFIWRHFCGILVFVYLIGHIINFQKRVSIRSAVDFNSKYIHFNKVNDF